MEQQNGANMMQTYFEIEASLSTPQYGFRRGLEIFGDEGYQAALKELDENLVGRGCIEVLPEADVTWEIRQIALGYLMFLKRKRNGKMKGRGCADGRPQREYISKEESSSPTVSIYALFGSCVIDALDERSVITIDIPGAFLQGIWPQDQHPGYLKFEGVMVDMLCQIKPSYQEYIIY
jgi:hypothetical protein